ncbi:helix-turn-helix domain-containing protein [Lysinibacillus antri]|uniref:MarR family transcriptional regulator n=1 Tax=Lysinibacillus antri TaxID=2498145 RepID=A0A432L772_9BACI|nr:helix-turn-helix domain-containing protein [Lysinibacillus antri]RUL47223.1 MarR family transcriptional regulator [Lysinibacillus antri]
MLLVNYLKKLNEGTDINVAANLGYVVTPHCIRRCLRLSQEEKLLLFEIYSLYNEERGCAFPTQQTLAMYLGVSSSSVSKSLKKLEEKGFIKSHGRKGKKKRYIPLFTIHRNPYLLLSETFHFATKIINKEIPEDISGDWGNKLLQFVNVNKKDEFTEKDPYGLLVANFEVKSSVEQLLNLITQYVSKSFSIELEINWKEKIDENKKSNVNKKENKEKSSYRKYNKESSRNLNLDKQAELEEWLREWEEADNDKKK